MRKTQRWIGRRGSAAEFSPRSPDLTSPDFYLWGALKSVDCKHRKLPSICSYWVEGKPQKKPQPGNLPRAEFEPGPPGFATRRADRYSTDVDERRMKLVHWADRIRTEAVLDRVGKERVMLKLIGKRKRK
ncbi:hypothetical protein ANN_18231 [Periplaneta americana]|uniref:Uncharacterized protein n=1 Tax=Periplaneta americana TaxID=6978 RepID=A0ABQ8SQA4_PERAM|nr:hypothetical protein ANN_18231 [Periplaneta americana]